MTKADKYLIKLLCDIKTHGFKDENPRPHWPDGTPAHTLSVNHQVREYDISKGEFPICTLRPIAWKSAIKEIFWIYQDADNRLDTLRNKYGIQYWNEWESKDMPGTIGARYGEVVRRYDLMNKLLDGLKNNPYGRRHIIDLYQYKELEETDGLSPCAFLTIWNVRNQDGITYLDLSLIQRSGDSIAASCSGVNETQYTALLMMVARHCGYLPGKLVHYVANEQVYDRHIVQAEELIARAEQRRDEEKTNGEKPEPKLVLNPDKTDFYSFTIDDFALENYDPIKPQLKFEIAI